MPTSSRQILRIVHQLGRSGGTLIAKCLAVMDKAVLLSEIHPYNIKISKLRKSPESLYLPMVQAKNWFNLVTDEDIREFEKSGPPDSFQAEISFIAARCGTLGNNLILRDFNNLDFTGINLRAEPPYRFLTVEALREQFDLSRIFTVRHPANQWISLSKIFAEDISPHIEKFMHGFRLFSEQAAETGFVRYEDFTNNPEGELEQICERLDLPYDVSWRDNWASYRNITGDRGAIGGENNITPSRKYSIDAALRRQLEDNADYRKTLKLLGYKD